MFSPRPLAGPVRLDLWATVTEWRAVWKPLLDAAGLYASEGIVLSALWEADGATEAGLARRALAPRDLIHDCVEKLRLLGYAEREEEPAGIWLTPDGLRLRDRAEQTLRREWALPPWDQLGQG